MFLVGDESFDNRLWVYVALAIPDEARRLLRDLPRSVRKASTKYISLGPRTRRRVHGNLKESFLHHQQPDLWALCQDAIRAFVRTDDRHHVLVWHANDTRRRNDGLIRLYFGALQALERTTASLNIDERPRCALWDEFPVAVEELARQRKLLPFPWETGSETTYPELLTVDWLAGLARRALRGDPQAQARWRALNPIRCV